MVVSVTRSPEASFRKKVKDPSTDALLPLINADSVSPYVIVDNEDKVINVSSFWTVIDVVANEDK